MFAKRNAFSWWRYVVARMTSKIAHKQVYGSMWVGTSLYYALRNRPVRAAWRRWRDFVDLSRRHDVRTHHGDCVAVAVAVGLWLWGCGCGCGCGCVAVAVAVAVAV